MNFPDYYNPVAGKYSVAQRDAMFDMIQNGEGIVPLLGKGKNLLVNWYFPNPINQRGYSSYSTVDDFTIDMWKLTSGSLTLDASGLTLNGTITQTLESPPSGTVTASVLTASGTATASYDNGVFTLTASGAVIIAVKLEIGDVQTLYSGTTLLDAEPDFATELAKCQRHCVVYDLMAYSTTFTAVGVSGTQARISVALPTFMKNIPTVTVGGSLYLYNGGSIAVTNIAPYSFSGGTVTLDVTAASGIVTGNSYMLLAGADTKLILQT